MNKSINLLNFIYQSTESGSNYVDPNGYDDIKKETTYHFLKFLTLFMHCNAE